MNKRKELSSLFKTSVLFFKLSIAVSPSLWRGEGGGLNFWTQQNLGELKFFKIKEERKTGVDVVRNCCGTLITRWMDEWMDELSWFFAYWCKFRKVENYFNNFLVVVVKNVHGTLISTCMNEPVWLFACYTYLRELKITLIVIGWAWWNMGWLF